MNLLSSSLIQLRFTMFFPSKWVIFALNYLSEVGRYIRL